ncbi:DNA-binding transcriptional LysR family regulator [Streptomyces griseochromogenes]|uniref:DNA-binding transcriptional LysR family regulator n=1 Tax=Streptomyces griseochromogenes TaxID=68214 RepID=A0A1B1AXT9_9ACTN|nr:LysR family transcriptional regulator [Streptomyces griseochromogenes]ANP51332.1 LysR family transcriptional regulator [Streptomyces griseochromogenes]MBP2049969.1 DNA-binding transcriptional LysR family regulator [Streptomyces griseochromogenes]
MDLLAHLEAYVATVDESSFSRAAERLGIAQPLLSRRIKTLEAHFGGPLFDRSRRQVSTTEFGMLLLPYARDVLDRAERLGRAARSARQARVLAVGVPADCAPAALARVIRSGAERGITLGVRELPPEEREAGLADGSLAYALVRVAPEQAALRVPLGLASAPPPDEPRPAHAGARTSRGRAVHLEDLRPRRSRAASGGLPTALPLLVPAEDEVPYAYDRLARAAARSGLPEGLIRSAGPAATALAETLAGRSVLLCAEPFARQHGARWAPLADVSLHRGYDVRGTPRQRGAVDVPDWLVVSLAGAAGAATGPPDPRRAGSAGEDVPARLAARG